jgi:MFS family permease
MQSAVPISKLLIPDVRGLPRAFWLLFSAALIDRIGGFAHVYVALYLTGPGGASVETAGIILSLLTFGGVVGTPIGGALADRIGRKPMLIGGLLLTAINFVVFSQLTSIFWIGVGTFAWGVFSSLARPAMVAAIADVVPEADRRRAFGLHYWAINAGFAFAASVAGLLSSVSWKLVFILDATTSVIAALLLLFVMRDLHGESKQARPAFRDLLRDPIRDGVFMTLVVIGVVDAMMFMQAHVALAVEMKGDGLAAQYGPLIAINGILIVLLQPTLTQVTTRFRSTRVLMAGTVLVGAGFFLTAFADGPPTHALAIVVWTLGEILLASTMPSVIQHLAPPDKRATYQGLYQLGWSAAAFAPALGAFVLDNAGSFALWGACLVLGIVNALVLSTIDSSPRLS